MSAVNAQAEAASKSASKKKKKGKKKANGQSNANTASATVNGSKEEQIGGNDDEDDDDDDSPSRAESVDHGSQPSRAPTHHPSPMPPSQPEGTTEEDQGVPKSNGASHASHTGSTSDGQAYSDTTARLDAMQKERDSLRAEVTELRKSLESLQEQHDEVSGVKEELEQTQQAKEHAETQYRNLLTKVNTIRSQLGERLKADAAELETARERIAELEAANEEAEGSRGTLSTELSNLRITIESQAAELETLRSRTNLSTSNWAKERDDLVSREAYLKEEYEVAKQAMQDWEILATEERTRREALEERMQELEEQLSGQQEAYERIKSESETQNSTVDGLQRALRDLQEERKRELREMVESSQAQLDALRAQTNTAEETAAELKKQLEITQKELDRVLPFEKEIKEKNLLIGKLRHEAVILNDHLTKALRFLKRGKPEDNVDRHLVTNHFLHFLALDRSDPKKFQILQLIAALLGWDETQKEQAGLLRQGTGLTSGSGSLRVPMSPFRRTPSTPTLGEFTPESPGGASRESLAELWSEFLEREAEAGGAQSRRPSVASGRSTIRSPSGMMSPVSETGRGPLKSPELKRKESQSGTSPHSSEPAK